MCAFRDVRVCLCALIKVARERFSEAMLNDGYLKPLIDPYRRTAVQDDKMTYSPCDGKRAFLQNRKTASK